MSYYGELPELKERLRLPEANSDHDDMLERLLNAATATVNRVTRRRFNADTAETVLIDCTRDNVMGRLLFLPDDFHTITAVVNGDGATIPATDYVTNPRQRVVDGDTVTAVDWPFYELQIKPTVRTTWTYRGDPLEAIAVTGYRGFSAIPPADIVEATYQLAMHVYRLPDKAERVVVSPDGVWLTPDSVPAYVKQQLVPYRKYV